MKMIVIAFGLCILQSCALMGKKVIDYPQTLSEETPKSKVYILPSRRGSVHIANSYTCQAAHSSNASSQYSRASHAQYLKKSKTYDIAADVPVYFRYQESTGNRFCDMYAKTILPEGEDFYLRTGMMKKSFFSSRTCNMSLEIGILDDKKYHFLIPIDKEEFDEFCSK